LAARFFVPGDYALQAGGYAGESQEARKSLDQASGLRAGSRFRLIRELKIFDNP
jgi:hypothetical protein